MHRQMDMDGMLAFTDIIHLFCISGPAATEKALLSRFMRQSVDRTLITEQYIFLSYSFSLERR